MKILHIIQKKQLRGAEVFASQLSTHLTAQGNHVLIVALIDGDEKLPFDGKIVVLNAKLHKKMFDFFAWKKLSKIIKEFKPDIIQANAADTIKYAVFSKLLFRWTIPIISRNASVVSKYAKSFISRFFIGFLYRHIDFFISVSEITRKDLIDSFLISSNKTITIPVGVEVIRLNPIINFDRSKINIVHVGGFTFEKNHFGLLSIFKMVLSNNQNYQLWLIGKGPLKSDIEELCDKMGLSSNVNFIGFVNNPMDYINAADLLVLPSIIEGLPAVIIEAFYCKTPVVAYNTGGISELVIDNQTGRLIDIGDEEQFSKAIIDLTSIENSKIEFITSVAYKKVILEYTNEKIAQRFYYTYNNILNNSH